MDLLKTLENGSGRQISEALQKRFAQNKLFFQKKDATLFDAMQKKASSFAITLDDGGVNIINIKNGELVYPCEDGRHQFLSASKKIAEDPYTHTSWEVRKNDVDVYEINDKYRVTGRYDQRVKELMFANRDYIPDVFHLPTRFLPSISFFGLGGGLFIEYLLQNYDRYASLFIYEPEVDFFVVSCYFVNYERLYAAGIFENVYICVGTELSGALAKEFFSSQKITAGFIRMELTLYEDERIARAKKIVELAQSSCVRGWGTYEDEMVGFENQRKNINFDKPALPIFCKPQKINAPICIVGNGASLDGLLDFLKKNQERMIIFSCGTTIRTLLKHGIKPDFQFEIERLDYLAGVLQESGYASDIPMIASNVVNPNTIALCDEPLMYFRDFTCGSYLREVRQVLHFGSPFVGNAALNMAVMLSDELILCGLDVGIKHGKTAHSQDSIYEEKDAGLPFDAVEVRPNFDSSVMYQTPLYRLSSDNMERTLAAYKPKSTLNLSDGAHIEGARSMRADQLTLNPIKKSAKIKLIKKAFSKNLGDVYSGAGQVDVVAGMHRLREETMAKLRVGVANKEELFRAFDDFSTELEDQYTKNISAAILLGGSLRHIMFNTFMSFIHIASNDVGALYQNAIQILDEAIVGFIGDFEAQNAKERAAKLLRRFL
jgi:hypothetical protein